MKTPPPTLSRIRRWLFPALGALTSLAGIAVTPLLGQQANLPAPGGSANEVLVKPDRPPSISLAPSVVMARGSFGQSLTQSLTFSNQTPNSFPFEMLANDVVVESGKRVFVPAGRLSGSIAATAMFSPSSGIVKPYSSATVEVRLTAPEGTGIRGVVVIFRGGQARPDEFGAIGIAASLGSLITFNLTDHVQLVPDQVQVSKTSDGSGIQISQSLANQGSEPVLSEGTAVFLDEKGSLSAKVSFSPQRLLPGEKLDFTAEYTGQLRPGTYKVLCSFEFEGKTLTSEGSYMAP